MLKRVSVFLVLLTGLACHGSTTAPTPANVAGTWSGTMSFTDSIGQFAQTVTMNLTQSGATVSGTWQTSGGRLPKNGTIGGTTTTSSFSGTFTVTITNPSTGTSCNGTLSVSGSAGGSALTWTSPGVVGGCPLDPPTNITFTVVRQ